MNPALAFAIGCAAGAGLLWLHFYSAGMLRTREEWERAQDQEPDLEPPEAP